MKYMILIYENPRNVDEWSEDELAAHWRAHLAFDAQLAESGVLVSSEGLARATEAKSVRVRDGVPAVTDGPFVEAKEYLAGYYLVECEHLDRALELAARVPDAEFHAVEVRPVAEMTEADL